MLARLSLLALISVATAAPILDATIALPNTTQSSSIAWYYQSNTVGACGNVSLDTDLVVGLPSNLYNSSYCGDYVVLKSPVTNGTVAARIADASATADLLLLSVATWAALNATSDNLSTVEWRFATANETAAAEAALLSATAPLSTSYIAPSTTEAAAAVTTAAATTKSSSTYVAPTTTKTTSTYVAPTTTSIYVEPTTTKKTTTTYYTPTTTSTSEYVAPTTTYVQAAATTKAASSSSSGSYSGQATYYFQNGNPGACGNYNSDSAYIVAIDIDMWNNGANCGRTVVITGNGKTISAVVADECPTCASSGSLDLSVGAFQALASESDGVASISWYFA